MALILNIESATGICSVGLSKGDELLALVENHEGNVHSEKITLLIADCMRDAGYELEAIDAVSVSEGPGSYTSLRVGSAVAKGICYALNKPMIAVSTLKSLAKASFAKEGIDSATYIPMIDARRMEVYMAVYDSDLQQLAPISAKVLDEQTMNEWKIYTGPLVISGSGMEKSKTVLKGSDVVFSEVLCSAAHVAPLAHQKYQNNVFTDMAYFSPMYFKAPNITVSKKKTL